MKKTHKPSLLVATLFLLVSCASDGKETDKTVKPATTVSNAVNTTLQDTYLKGKIIGDFNGKAFSHFNKKERPGKIRQSNKRTIFNITFAALQTNIVTISVLGYHGADSYTASNGASFKVIDFKNPKGKFKLKDNAKLKIMEDDETHVKGSISFVAISEQKEEIVINAQFDLTKVVIDLNNQEALLKEIKDNPGIVESIGRLKSDKDFMLKAISINTLAFKYADKPLKADRVFILKALQDNPKSFLLLMHVNKDIKSDKAFALKAVKINSRALHLMDKKLRKDKDVIAASKGK